MQKNKLLLFILLSLCTASYAQEEAFTSQPVKKGEHALVAYLGGGMSYYLRERGALPHLNAKINHMNPMASLRVMWHPDHLLKVGLETGHLTFYNYSFQDSIRNSGSVRLRATPLLVEWSMAVTKRLNLFAGSGIYFFTTDLDYLGKASSNKMSIGWMAAGSYIYPLSENFGLGAEVKWFDAAETFDGIIIGQLQLVWKFKKWK